MPDEHYMQIALRHARRGLGRTWPNPAVGCVIVKDGEIVGIGCTAVGGRPHAETIALESAGDNAKGAIAYVTLEPCSHHGKTPPCAEALIKAGIAEIIIGCTDSDSRVNGKGTKLLESAGIRVTTGILEKECRELNKGFFKRIEKGLPHVMLKVAVSKDLKYLPGDGAPRWVTGELARNNVHLLRSQYDAIITGTGTILADDPHLNCRLPGMEEYSPVKVVIGDSPIPPTANIYNGREVIAIPAKTGLAAALKTLADKGFTRIMVEAGPRLSNALLKAHLVDEVIIYKSPQVLGKEGLDFFAPKSLDKFTKTSEMQIGPDLKITLTP